MRALFARLDADGSGALEAGEIELPFGFVEGKELPSFARKHPHFFAPLLRFQETVRERCLGKSCEACMGQNAI